MTLTLKIRRGLAADWNSRNPVLAPGELGVELDTDRLKIGDGFTHWTSLPFYLTQASVNSLISAALEDVELNGVQGPKGDTGATGATGATGPQGPKGDTGESGGGVLIADSGFITTGNIVIGTSFTQLGPDLSIPASAGDILEILPDLMLNASLSNSDGQLEAATRVGGVDANWWSSGNSASRWPGGVPSWYLPASIFSHPAPARYTVQAGDVVSGSVTVRLYGRVPSSTATLFANGSYPLRWFLTNFGSGS